jgi:two-component system response regulator MprA
MTKACILIVDDDRAVRETLADALELDDYEVLRARDGREAMAILDRRRPDAIVLDLMMPTMDGWEFRRLQREAHGGIPLVVVSAADDPRLEEVQADAYLMKPFDLDTFLVVLRGVIRRRAQDPAG